MILKIKYRFRYFPLLFYTTSGEFWQESYISNNKNYPARQIKVKDHQGSLKYRINRKWYSKTKLNSLAYLINEEYNTKMLPNSEMPF